MERGEEGVLFWLCMIRMNGVRMWLWRRIRSGVFAAGVEVEFGGEEEGVGREEEEEEEHSRVCEAITSFGRRMG